MPKKENKNISFIEYVVKEVDGSEPSGFVIFLLLVVFPIVGLYGFICVKLYALMGDWSLPILFLMPAGLILWLYHGAWKRELHERVMRELEQTGDENSGPTTSGNVGSTGYKYF